MTYFKLQRNWIKNGSCNIKDPSTEIFQLQMEVMHQSICISKANHSFLKIYQKAGVSCNYKLKWPKFKDLCIKSTEKELQDEWMYVGNTLIVKRWNFSRRFKLDYDILLPVLNASTVDTEEAIPRKIPWKASIIISVSCDTLRLQNIYFESFNCSLTKSGWLSAVYLWIWLKGSEIYIRVGSILLRKGQKAFKIRPVSLKSRSPRTSLKRISAGVKHSNYQKRQYLHL